MLCTQVGSRAARAKRLSVSDLHRALAGAVSARCGVQSGRKQWENSFKEAQLLALILRARVILVSFALSEVGEGGLRVEVG